jgi:DeoR family fructose operon transcriptional repressor
MYGEERRRSILAMARQNRRVSVTSLAETFTVAAETIRRDLLILERQAVLLRVHGGAVPVEMTDSEPPLESRSHTLITEKYRIAKAALDEVPEIGSVFIEAGSTPAQLGALLPTNCPLTVVTNSVYLAMSLAQKANLTVISVGGRVRHRTMACVDDWALRTLADLFVDVAFLGTNGISLGRGLTTPDPAEAAVKKTTLSISRRKVLLADHTKVGAVSLCRYGEVADIDVIVTDTGLSRGSADELESVGPRVVRV